MAGIPFGLDLSESLGCSQHPIIDQCWSWSYHWYSMIFIVILYNYIYIYVLSIYFLFIYVSFVFDYDQILLEFAIKNKWSKNLDQAIEATASWITPAAWRWWPFARPATQKILYKSIQHILLVEYIWGIYEGYYTNYYTILYYTILYYTILYYIILYYLILYYFTVHYIIHINTTYYIYNNTITIQYTYTVYIHTQ